MTSLADSMVAYISASVELRVTIFCFLLRAWKTPLLIKGEVEAGVGFGIGVNEICGIRESEQPCHSGAL